MLRTIRGRIVLGFGTIIVMLMASTAVNVTLLSGINRGFGGFVSALDQTSDTVNIDLVMTKVRVRVNQWLRSLDPKFAAKADDLLTQDLGLVDKAASLASNDAERQTVGDLDRALNAYVGSWHAVRDYYAQEAKLYDERLLGPAAGIAADLARLRDSDKASRALVVQFDAARDDFIAAELAAMAYRTSPQPAAADRTRAAIGGAIAKLLAASDASGSSVDADLVARTTAALRAWQDAFAETVKVTEARVARIASWTANEGEAMAVGANKLRLMNEEQAAHARKTITRTIKNSGVTLYALSGGIILAGILLSLALSRAITRPIGRMTAALKALAGGDRSADVPETGRRDEIGEMAKAAQVFKETAIEMERMVTLQKAAQARETLERQAARRQTADSFDVAIGGLVGMLSSAASELEATAHSMSSTAAQTGQKASAVAASAEMASAGVQTVSAAAEQLTASIREISRQVAHSSEITNQAVNEARRTDGIVQTLSDTAQKIGDVVGLISNIAGQTNLLALNATIEAARAGDAGKGFAVVASEVKNLAQQTAKATGDIGTQVAQIQDATKEAVSAIGGISRTIEDVRAIAAMIAAAVDEQNAATSEIARSVQDTATSTRAVTEHIGSVSQSADETGQATGNVLSAAGGVSQQAARLQAEVAAFVASVRAG